MTTLRRELPTVPLLLERIRQHGLTAEGGVPKTARLAEIRRMLRFFRFSFNEVQVLSDEIDLELEKAKQREKAKRYPAYRGDRHDFH